MKKKMVNVSLAREKKIIRNCIVLWMVLMLAAIPAMADFDFGLKALTKEMTREMEKASAEVAHEMEEASKEYWGAFYDMADLIGYDSPYLGVGNDDKKWIDDVPDGKYIEVTYDQLLRELDENAFLAAKTYKDQFVCVEGRLSTIDSDGDYISLESDKHYFDSMICYIRSQKALDQLVNLKSGKMIRVYGKITDVGEVLGYYMDVYDIQ